MKVQETVRRETKRIALGTVLLTALMMAVYLLLGAFCWKALLESLLLRASVIGAAIGCFAAVLDFFLLGLSVQNAAEYQAAHPLTREMIAELDRKAEEGKNDEDSADSEKKRPYADPETAAVIRAKMKRSYMLRRMLLLAFAALGLIKSINMVTLIIPLLFPRLVIMVINLLINKKGGN